MSTCIYIYIYTYPAAQKPSDATLKRDLFCELPSCKMKPHQTEGKCWITKLLR